MKLSPVVVALAVAGSADAYSVNRSTLRNLGQKSVQASSAQRNAATISSSLKMEGES